METEDKGGRALKLGINTLDDFNFKGKTVICRVDINSPLDLTAKVLRDISRIKACLPTLQELSDKGAKVVILAHQGGDLEYKNFASTELHAKALTELLDRKVEFIDDVCGPAARERIRSLKNGDILLLDNVRYMSEEMTLFETKLNLTPEEQSRTKAVKQLAPLAHCYVCDAFAAAHRSQPSLVGFEEVLPSAMGRLFEKEIEMLTKVINMPQKPCVFILGGAKIQDAFMMMSSVLEKDIADLILTGGLVANIMLLAAGIDIGKISREFLFKSNLEGYILKAREILSRFPNRIELPQDLVYIHKGEGLTVDLGMFPQNELLVDIGKKTINRYERIIKVAQTIFINGPMGVFEKEASKEGTKAIWQAVTSSSAFTVMGGGDSIAAANKFDVLDKFSYVSTAGGGLVRFLSGEELPVVKALRKATLKHCILNS